MTEYNMKKKYKKNQCSLAYCTVLGYIYSSNKLICQNRQNQG